MSNLKTNDLKSFIYLENGEIEKSQFSTLKVSNKLEPNIYTLEYIEHPIYDTKIAILNNKEDSKIFNFDNKNELDKYFDSFFNINFKEAVESLGFNHKFGILLHGNAGNGKSTIIKYYYTKAIKEHNALVFYLKNSSPNKVIKCWDLIKNIRAIQENPIVLIMDEFDTYLEESQSSSVLKKILDGENSINNCLFLAATNFINNIPREFKERKSRFRYTLEISKINDIDSIYDILYFMLNKIHKEDEIKQFSKELKNHSLDEIKQFSIDKLMNIKNDKTKFKKAIGFFNHITN